MFLNFIYIIMYNLIIHYNNNRLMVIQQIRKIYIEQNRFKVKKEQIFKGH